MSTCKTKITGKLEPTDFDWFIRFQLDPAKAQADYFKYYPDLKPSKDIVKNIDDYALKAFTNVGVMASLNFHKEIWMLYQYMDTDTQKAFFEYTHNSKKIQSIPNQVKTLDMSDIKKVKKIINKSWNVNKDPLEENLLKGLYLFNKLSGEEQLKIVQETDNWIMKVILSFHPNQDVREYLVHDISQNGGADYNDVVAIYKKLGFLTSASKTIHDDFILNFLDGDIHQVSYKPRPLADFKRHENGIKSSIHKDSPILNDIQGAHSAYALKLFFEKNPEEAKKLLPNFKRLSKINDISTMGEALLLEPESQFLREKIFAKIFKDMNYFSMDSIRPNQIANYADFFVKCAIKYPDEWDKLCDQISNYELLKRYEQEREDIITRIFHGPEHYKYSRDEWWELWQPFNGNFVKVLLLAHLGHGIPLNNALQPLILCLEMNALSKLMSFKNMKAYQSQWQILKCLYEDNASKSVEHANKIILSILGHEVHLPTSEINLIC